MKLLDYVMDGLCLRARPLPADMTAALEPMFSKGKDGTGVALTGHPQFLGIETDGDGICYAQFRLGFAPDAHMIVRTPKAAWFAALADEAIKAAYALNPVPEGLGGPE